MSSAPECNLACQTKIILNGGRVAAESQMAQAIASTRKLTEEEAYQLIAIWDEAEDKLSQWNDRMLKKTGYKRRTQKFMLEEV